MIDLGGKARRAGAGSVLRDVLLTYHLAETIRCFRLAYGLRKVPYSHARTPRDSMQEIGEPVPNRRSPKAPLYINAGLMGRPRAPTRRTPRAGAGCNAEIRYFNEKDDPSRTRMKHR